MGRDVIGTHGLWQHMTAAAVVVKRAKARVVTHLAHRQTMARSPWFVGPLGAR